MKRTGHTSSSSRAIILAMMAAAIKRYMASPGPQAGDDDPETPNI